MKTDRTTKLLLLVIALALTVIALRPQPVVPLARAQEAAPPAVAVVEQPPSMRCIGKLMPKTTGASQGHGGGSSTIVVPGYEIEVRCDPLRD